MLKHEHVYRRMVAPLTFALLLIFVVTPSTFASSDQHRSIQAFSLIGPKSHYLALGDSLAFGYQPNLNFSHGYVDDFYSDLRTHGTSSLANIGCPGETSVTFLNGNCPYAYLRKYSYTGAQLKAALAYLALYAGQVSPVTLDIGANDVNKDINTSTCTINLSQFQADLATLDNNLTQTILPALHNALMVNGHLTGDLVMMNYYDPYQNICPNSLAFTQTINQHLQNDMSGYGSIVDVFNAFGGTTTPNPHICSYTWMCSVFTDIHATNTGYSVIATTFENGTGY
ncbi:MAG: hypothetical protein ACJ788_17580 [Ktedonobacteraceae bacterium]